MSTVEISTVEITPTPLGLSPDELVACVSCGLCLPHCPTYRVTGLEIASPRGRILAMRAVESGDAPIDKAFVTAMEECVQCRGCEAACPSGVPFGRLMEGTRTALAERSTPRGWSRHLAETIALRWVLPKPIVLRALSWLLLLAQRLHLVPKRFRSSLPQLTPSALRTKIDVPVGGDPDVWLFTGCVMDAWMRETHVAAAKVVRATGATLGRPDHRGACCGALAVHAGRLDEARRLARNVIESMPGNAPILVDSAGCGAALKDYGHLLADDTGTQFAARVFDISEWIAGQRQPAVRSTGRTVVIQDPCHLRHVQKAHGAVRTVLAGAYELREAEDDGLCCGAGGAYAALQPELASEIRERKAASLRAAAAGDSVIVCSANPGCTIQLRAAGFTVAHPMELLADALEVKEDP
jgi:glycolate oxidase iron-sulfur subunit